MTGQRNERRPSQGGATSHEPTEQCAPGRLASNASSLHVRGRREAPPPPSVPSPGLIPVAFLSGVVGRASSPSGLGPFLPRSTYRCVTCGSSKSKASITCGMPTVTRKIVFFKINAGQDAAGRPLLFDAAAALRFIEQLPFEPGERYLEIEPDEFLALWVDRPGNPYPRGRLAVSRRASLPLVENAGHVSQIPIARDAGLLEPTHLVFFPGNILGAEFNFYGPRAGRLARYLREKLAPHTGVAPPQSVEQLIREDALTRLHSWEALHLFDLSVRASLASQVRLIDESLADAFDAAARAGEADQVELVLRKKRRSKVPLSDRLLRAAKELLPQLGSDAQRFTVKGPNPVTGEIEMVNLLRDVVSTRVPVERESKSSRALNSGAMYEAIESAYVKMKPQIETASDVVFLEPPE